MTTESDRTPSPRRRRYLVWIVTLVTLGSGLLNLLSVIGPSLRERRALLREVFPLEFLHISRFLTLLIGFGLLILSLNIARRKKRAYELAFLLASFSVLTHLTKGLDYEEALFSLAFLGLLLFARRDFTVESSTPDLGSGLVRFGAATLIALFYGVAGFWLLDPHHFGMNFHWNDAIRETIQFLTLSGDPQVVPHTRYAYWFLDSLYLTTITAIVYSGFAVFRPVVYAFAIHPHEIVRARELVRKHGRCLQDFFKYYPDKSFYFARSGRAFVAYSVGKNFAVALGDPVAPAEELEATIREFAEYCRNNDWGLAFHQALPDFLPVYRKLGFKKLKIGDEAIVDLKGLGGGSKKLGRELRRASALDKLGLCAKIYDPPVSDEILHAAKEVSEEWLEIPGRRERRFTLGRFDPHYLRTTPIFAVYNKDGRMLAFGTLLHSYRPGEASLDLMRRRAEGPNGIMDYLFLKLFLYLKEQGYERFNMGLAPMAGFQEKEEASREEKAVHFFLQRLNFMFSYKGLRDYKAKFASFWEPRYEVYRNVLDLPRLAIALGSVTEIREE